MRYLSGFILSLVFFFASVGVIFGMDGMDHGASVGCPFSMDQQAMCPMSALTHLNNWQNLFRFDLVLLVSLVIGALVVTSLISLLFGKESRWRIKWRVRYGLNFNLLANFYLLQFLSQGIINPKLF